MVETPPATVRLAVALSAEAVCVRATFAAAPAAPMTLLRPTVAAELSAAEAWVKSTRVPDPVVSEDDCVPVPVSPTVTALLLPVIVWPIVLAPPPLAVFAMVLPLPVRARLWVNEATPETVFPTVLLLPVMVWFRATAPEADTELVRLLPVPRMVSP